MEVILSTCQACQEGSLGVDPLHIRHREGVGTALAPQEACSGRFAVKEAYWDLHSLFASTSFHLVSPCACIYVVSH